MSDESESLGECDRCGRPVTYANRQLFGAMVVGGMPRGVCMARRWHFDSVECRDEWYKESSEHDLFLVVTEAKDEDPVLLESDSDLTIAMVTASNSDRKGTFTTERVFGAPAEINKWWREPAADVTDLAAAAVANVAAVNVKDDLGKR